MSNKWQDSYRNLQDFITANPGIEISATFTVIPGEVKTEFYRLFDDVGSSLLDEKFPALTREAEILSERYIRAEQEVTELLKLEAIFTMVPIHRFLHNPRKELMKELTDPLFELLKGRATPEVFEQKVSRSIEAGFKANRSLGYAKWVALSLVKLLESDMLFHIPTPEAKVTPHGEPVHLEKPVPPPEETKNLSFEHGPHLYVPFILPHFIVHSARLNRYVSIRTELVSRAEFSADNASERKEWMSLDPIEEQYMAAVRNPSLLVYLGDKPEELALVADKYRICRPDLIVDCRQPEDWGDKEKLAEIEFFNALNPNLGRYVVSMEPIPAQIAQVSVAEPISIQTLPEQGNEKKEEKPVICNLTVGFSQSDLEPVIEAMMKFDSQGIDGKAQLPTQRFKRSQYYPD